MSSTEFVKKPLEELVEIHDSKRIPVKKSERKAGPYPYYGASGITDYIDDYIFEGEYLLLAEDGDNIRTKNTPLAFLANGKFWVNNHAHILTGKNGNNTKFLCYALQVADIDSYVSGSTRPKITQSDLKRIPVFAPISDTQNSIAQILGTLDDKIELNRKMNQTLEQMAQTVYKSWFVDFDPVINNAIAAGNDVPEPLQKRALRRSDFDDKRKPLPKDIQELFPNEFEFNGELEMWVPKGWGVKPLEDCLEINPSLKLSKGSLAKHVDMKSLPTEGYIINDYVNKKYTGGGAKFQQGDVLLARITPCLENGKTGIIDFLNGQEVAFGSTEFIVLRGKGEIKTPLVACLARETSVRNHCIQSMVGSSGRQRVQITAFNNYYFALPTAEILKGFDRIAKPFFTKMTALSKEIKSLIEIRDNLLPMLISGRITTETV